MKTTKNPQRVALYVIFAIYILVVLNLTVIRHGFRYDERQFNPVLFVDLIDILRYVGIGEFLRLFLGNIGWFIPFGFLLPMILKRDSLIIVAACGFAFSLAIEITQYFTRKGVAEPDDLILNVLGAVIGYCAYRLVRWGGKRSS